MHNAKVSTQLTCSLMTSSFSFCTSSFLHALSLDMMCTSSPICAKMSELIPANCLVCPDGRRSFLPILPLPRYSVQQSSRHVLARRNGPCTILFNGSLSFFIQITNKRMSHRNNLLVPLSTTKEFDIPPTKIPSSHWLKRGRYILQCLYFTLIT